MDERAVYRLADDVTWQSMGEGDDTVILSLTTGALFTCNATTAALLGALDAARPFGAVVDAVAERFDVARDRLAADLAEMVERMVQRGLVVRVEDAR
ncbi:MAG: PqqD family protein [Planctomycetes bacterium]|nr:PqqD family protein [Planctomycetota bacterium]